MSRLAQALRITALFAMAAAAVGCAGKPHLNSASELQSGEVILVGRIELVPPLFPNEQSLLAPLTGRFRDKATGVFSDALYDGEESPVSFHRNGVLVELGRDFYVRQPMSKTLFYSGGTIMIMTNNKEQRDMKLPGGLQYTLKPDDRAVYVGTLRYHRDDYNAITKTEFINDYARANQAFVAKYGSGVKLRNVAPSPVRND